MAAILLIKRLRAAGDNNDGVRDRRHLAIRERGGPIPRMAIARSLYQYAQRRRCSM
jgi:hypothetical protein